MPFSLLPRRPGRAASLVAMALAAIALSAPFVCGSAAQPARALEVTPRDFSTWHEVALASPGGHADAIATDAMGQLVWYADAVSDELVSVDLTTGIAARHDLGASHPVVIDLVVAPGGDVWFGDSANGAICRFDPRTSVLQSFPLGGAFDLAFSVVVGPDGNVWFGDPSSGGIARIEADGTLTRVPDPDGALVTHLVSAPDGRLWYTRDGLSSLGSYDPRTGVIDILPLGLAEMSGLAVSGAGDLWVGAADALARVGLDGSIAIIPIPAPVATPVIPRSLVAGTAATLYFTDANLGIGRVDSSGVIRFLRPPFAAAAPDRLTVTPAGFLWYTDGARGALGWV